MVNDVSSGASPESSQDTEIVFPPPGNEAPGAGVINLTSARMIGGNKAKRVRNLISIVDLMNLFEGWSDELNCLIMKNAVPCIVMKANHNEGLRRDIKGKRLSGEGGYRRDRETGLMIKVVRYLLGGKTGVSQEWRLQVGPPAGSPKAGALRGGLAHGIFPCSVFLFLPPTYLPIQSTALNDHFPIEKDIH